MRTRQELLENLLKKEMEELRKICFKHKRKPFLENKVTIIEADLSNISEENIAGLYEKTNIKDEYTYEHKISISTEVINSYINYKRNYYDKYFGRTKKFYKKQLRQVIRHELIHAFVEERYEDFSDIKGTARDSSPIFLSALYFLNSRSGHDCWSNFIEGSQLYKDVTQLKTFKELDSYLIKMIRKYEKAVSLLEENRVMKPNEFIVVKNKFEYSHRNAGLLADCSSIITSSCNDKSLYTRTESNSFEIGCNITPGMITNLVHKKINSGSFNTIEVDKHYFNKATNTIFTRDKEGKLSKSIFEIPKSA